MAHTRRAATQVMDLLAAGVPLSLLMDLADPVTDSATICASEPAPRDVALHLDLTVAADPLLRRAGLA